MYREFGARVFKGEVHMAARGELGAGDLAGDGDVGEVVLEEVAEEVGELGNGEELALLGGGRGFFGLAVLGWGWVEVEGALRHN